MLGCLIGGNAIGIQHVPRRWQQVDLPTGVVFQGGGATSCVCGVAIPLQACCTAAVVGHHDGCTAVLRNLFEDRHQS